jgi:hypothetical protein
MAPLTPEEALTAFLRTNYPERYCASCLALQFNSSLDDTCNTLNRLVDRGAVLAGTRVCHSCGRTVEVFTGSIGVRRKAP